jgi:hypothetical protein
MPPPYLRVIKPCSVIMPIELEVIIKLLAVIQVAVVFQGAQGVAGAKAGYEHAEGVVVVLLQGGQRAGVLFHHNSSGIAQMIT